MRVSEEWDIIDRNGVAGKDEVWTILFSFACFKTLIWYLLTQLINYDDKVELSNSIFLFKILN